MVDEDTLYWLFTTAPQTIAALVAITVTGMIFMVGNIENRVKMDSTLYDIAEAAKVSMFRSLRVVAGFSMLVIAYDLAMVRGVKCISTGKGISEYLYGGFWAFNISSLIVVAYYIFQVVNPKYFDRIIKNMSKDYKGGNVDKDTFLHNFINFEKIVRGLGGDNRRNQFASLMEINYMLLSDGIITKDEARQLSEARKIRNLIVHGHDIDKIDRKYNDSLLQITEKIRKQLGIK